MLTCRRSDHLKVIDYSDSDYAGCMNSRKSTFGYIFLLAGGAVSWKSAKQSLIVTSTMEVDWPIKLLDPFYSLTMMLASAISR